MKHLVVLVFVFAAVIPVVAQVEASHEVTIVVPRFTTLDVTHADSSSTPVVQIYSNRMPAIVVGSVNLDGLDGNLLSGQAIQPGQNRISSAVPKRLMSIFGYGVGFTNSSNAVLVITVTD